MGDNEVKYHVVESCNKCRTGKNKIKVVSSDDGHMCECKTKCESCSHEDHWAYGFFESGQEMVSNCRKYINDNGKLVFESI